MKVALIQSNLVWENPKANREIFTLKINEIQEKMDLIVLPEMFTTGFTMHPNFVAETMDGETVHWMVELAKAKNAAITGSIIIQENKQYYNRMLFVFPNGEIQYYNKKHLFSLAGEEKIYRAGEEKVIVDYLGWKICLMVCYDLRFPVWSRNQENYDVLIYVASWPEVRIKAWDALLQARAIENMSYVIAVNRVGLDYHNYNHSGHSQVINHLGEYSIEPQENEGTYIVNLGKEQMLSDRKRFGFLNDKDIFNLE